CSIAAQVVTQESLPLDTFDIRGIADVDVILVDEAHNFRNKRAKRYMQLENILAANGRRGRDGGRKKLILLTATPINNNIFDLYNQINLFTGNDRTYFASAGIGDLYKYFLAARRESIEEGSIRIFNLLEEVSFAVHGNSSVMPTLMPRFEAKPSAGPNDACIRLSMTLKPLMRDSINRLCVGLSRSTSLTTALRATNALNKRG
ncbi:DEAD/DEAH box helicase, partial [bacterium]|nr:DEAD/DEAH box helicase [bacterium]